ncbi:MAG: hypothetical protein AAB290_01375 [Candidatus Eisenbacteria bacterium]
MPAPTRLQAHAFRDLERALTRRRLLRLDPRMRGELVLLALLIAGFLFWQVRVPLDGLVRARGPLSGVAAVAGVWLGLATLGAALAGTRHARRLRAAPAGPEWLALPLEPAAIERHLAWESRSHVLWLAVPALGVLAAAAGLLPAWWLASLAAAFAWLLLEAGRVGCALGYRVALRAAEPRPGLPPIERVLAVAAPGVARRRLPPPMWRKMPAWAALAGKDLVVTLRHGPTRRAAVLPLALWVASLLAWHLPGEPALRHVVAFALVLLAAAALAEWLAVLAGSDPFAALRVLPVGVMTVWGARFAWGVAGATVLVAGQAVAARELAPHARQVLLVWSGGAALAIATLGVNYGVTLFPRADVARRMLGLSLALAVAASVMIPLSGWIVLLTAVLHSARRLPRWSRLAEA